MRQEGFNILAESIRGNLLRIAENFIVGSGLREDASDIVQETLMALWKYGLQGKSINNPEALGIRIVKNICITKLRKQNAIIESIQGDEYQGGIPADANIELEEAVKLKKYLLSTLTKTQRCYIEMRNEEGLSLDEIAQRTSKPKTSIKATLSAARKQMYKLLKEKI